MEKRLDAMLQAAALVQPALDEFYATLGNEQKARFNTLPQVAGPDRTLTQSRSPRGDPMKQWHFTTLLARPTSGRRDVPVRRRGRAFLIMAVSGMTYMLSQPSALPQASQGTEESQDNKRSTMPVERATW
ncbi:Spy/CpxP family protein refolding chaperone [Bradyrhizobium sp. RDT10]